MLQIEEWFRRPQRKTERKAAPVTRPGAVHRTEDTRPQTAGQKAVSSSRVSEEMAAEFAAEAREAAMQQAEQTEAVQKEVVQKETVKKEAVQKETAYEESVPEASVESAVEGVRSYEPEAAEKAVPEEVLEPELTEIPENDVRIAPADDAEDMFEPEDFTVWKRAAAKKDSFVSGQRNLTPQRNHVAVQMPDRESDELEHISEQIGLDVAGMIDMEKEDILLQQIDEFREKAKQLQQLMQSRETKAKELQGVVNERKAKANELDSLIHVRRGEAEKIMDNVTERIDAMSAGVRSEMSGLSDTVSKEVSGLTQNLAHELNQSTEKTRQVVEAATQNMIDQNTRSLEGLKEQLEQLGHLEQIGELSTEMNSQITTLKTDIADKIHAEDVKCYRNIQASMDEQSKLLSEGDEKTRQHIQEQVDSLSVRMRGQSRLMKVSLAFTVLNFLGIVGILAFLILF